MLKRAEDVHFLNDAPYEPEKIQARNEWMMTSPISSWCSGTAGSWETRGIALHTRNFSGDNVNIYGEIG
jgi:hypothetical protein